MNEDVMERFLLNGCAFIPDNGEGVGEQLNVLLQDGQCVTFNGRAQTFLERTVKHFGGDLVALRKIYGQVIGRKQHIPLPLAESFTLVPYKVRKPIGRQGAYGWLVAEHILSVQRKDRLRTAIYLTGSHEVTSLQSVESCRQQLRHVLLVRQHYGRLYRRPSIVREGDGDALGSVYNRLFEY